jgi:hypothetical protein
MEAGMSDFDEAVSDKALELRVLEAARRKVEMEGFDFPKRRTLADIRQEPKPEWVIRNLMTIGVYGLAGPPEAGKSLLARDWLDAVANGITWNGYYRAPRQRAVTYVISEGHHDLDERFAGIPDDRIGLFTEPVILTDKEATADFIRQHDGIDTGLVVFDIVYDMGMADDNGVKDVAPVISASRRIAQALKCAVLLLGHPGHNTGRRFRGSSMWRGRFDGEFHMAEGIVTCEKHKYARKSALAWPYKVDFPAITYLDDTSAAGQQARRKLDVQKLAEQNPAIGRNQLALLIAQQLGCSESTAKRELRDLLGPVKTGSRA